MKVVTLNSSDIKPISDEVLDDAKAVLKNGGLLVYPTDTLYALGATIFKEESLDILGLVKGRDLEQTPSAVAFPMRATNPRPTRR